MPVTEEPGSEVRLVDESTRSVVQKHRRPGESFNGAARRIIHGYDLLLTMRPEPQARIDASTNPDAEPAQ